MDEWIDRWGMGEKRAWRMGGVDSEMERESYSLSPLALFSAAWTVVRFH